MIKRTPSPRPFRLSDALILIVATALGLAMIKFVETFNEGIFKRVEKAKLFGADWDERVLAWEYFMNRCVFLIIAMVLPLSVSLLGLRLRQPRPRLCRIWRQPGAVACMACILLPLHYIFVLIGQAVPVQSYWVYGLCFALDIALAWRKVGSIGAAD